MQINLSGLLAQNSAAAPTDVRQIKIALNHLGYYTPYNKVGISTIPDSNMFAAIKNFQQDHKLPVTGDIRPDDDTLNTLKAQLAEPLSGKYIWRCVHDDKVRDAHARYNGSTRKWEDHPAPGEEYNCRCWADSVEKPTGLTQYVISSTAQAEHKWSNDDFIDHWKNGSGQGVTLSEIGWLVDVIAYAKKNMFHRVEQQIIRKAYQVQNGDFSDTWERSYNFKPVIFSIGDTVIRGHFKGNVEQQGSVLQIKAIAHYLLEDAFTDPADVRETLYGTSSPDVLADNIAGKIVLFLTEAGNAPYPITGE